MSILDSIYKYAEQSDYIDTEHVLPLGIGLFVSASFFLNISPIISIFAGLDNSGLSTLMESAFKGLIGGLITTMVYTAGDLSFIVGKSMVTKEKAMFIVLAAMLGVGFGVDVFAPEIINQLMYPTLQLAGLVFTLVLVFVHFLVNNWRLENEWPHLVAGGLVVIAPLL